jgi:hypothetical protein
LVSTGIDSDATIEATPMRHKMKKAQNTFDCTATSF